MQYRDALKYISNNKSGKIEDLESIFGKKITSGLALTGMINLKINCWEVTNKGKKIHHIEDLYSLNKTTLFEKIQNFLNSFFFKNIMKQL